MIRTGTSRGYELRSVVVVERRSSPPTHSDLGPIVVGVRVGDAVVVGWSGATEAGGWIAGVTTPSCGAGAVVDVGSALGDSSPAATVVAVGPAST